MVMASAFWGDEPVIECDIGTPALLDATAADKAVSLNWSEPATGDVSGYSLYYDQSGKAQKVEDLDCSLTDCTRYIDTGLSNGQSYCYKVTAWNEQCESAFSNILCATRTPGSGRRQHPANRKMDEGRQRQRSKSVLPGDI